MVIVKKKVPVGGGVFATITFADILVSEHFYGKQHKRLAGKCMQKIATLKNTVQDYAWGSAGAIPNLLGRKNPSNKPQAELWMGAHPKAPSMVNYENEWIPLSDLIERRPQQILGKDVASKYDNRLPYLFKVLAAAKPLSIQAHPNLLQAKEGFARENKQGIPLDAGHRNYRDSNHKPECIFALSPFWVLCGFRKISEILAFFERICPRGFRDQIAGLRGDQNPGGLRRFFSELMTTEGKQRQKVICEAMSNVNKQIIEDGSAFQWIRKLAEEYPDDIGIFSPILLNLFCLEPGQAIFLEAGVLHAYLQGTGIELMANSDNVLRGGLTPKHIDVAELLNILRFEEKHINIIEPRDVSDVEKAYPCPAEEFVLSAIHVTGEANYQSSGKRSVEILLCVDGAAELADIDRNDILSFRKGCSVLVPAAVPGYTLRGAAIVYKAAVPLSPRDR
jgi:mannose-6-phosphate isomerase